MNKIAEPDRDGRRSTLKVKSIKGRDHSVAEVIVELPDGDDIDSLLAAAFVRAVSFVQHFQRAFHLVRRYPLHLASWEKMPPALPVMVGVVVDDPSVGVLPVRQWEEHVLEMHETPWAELRTRPLSSTEYKALDEALWRDTYVSVYTAYVDLRREAIVSSERDGNYRACITWASAAGEMLLDDLLKHLLWEENKRPEECVGMFRPGLVDRIRQHYRPRLGGDWDLYSPGPLRDWLQDIVWKRNAVVHEAYVPSRQEAKKAVESLDILLSHLGDLLVFRLGSYPRTAYTLLGDDGMARRGVNDPKLDALVRDESENPWMQTFARWRAVHGLLVRDDRFEPRQSSTNDATVMFVYNSEGKGFWCASDPRTDQSTKVKVDLSGVHPGMVDTIREHLSQAASVAAKGPRSIGFIDDAPPIAKVLPPWRERYRLVPDYGVMCTRADIDRKLFDWTIDGPTY